MIAHVGSVPVEEWAVIVVPMVALVVVYGRGLRTMTGLTDRGLRFLALTGALGIVAASSTETAEKLVAVRFSVHMAQHLLFLVPVPLLLVYSKAGRCLTMGLPRSWRRVTAPLRRLIIRLVMGPWSLGVVGVLYLLVLWSWHLPVLYDAAVDDSSVHVLEHASFLIGGLLLWSALTNGARPAFHRMMLLFATALHSGFLGAVLMLAPVVLYQAQATSPANGLDPLADQHLAGVIMWVPMSVVFLVTLLMVFARELRRPGIGSVVDD